MDYRKNYEAWLKDFRDDEKTYEELQAIAGDEKEIEDRFYTDLAFGTAGMRGVIGIGTNRMNVYTVRRATKGLADYINQDSHNQDRGVVIAYDSRRMSEEFAKETALVLCAQGIKAYLFDALRPVPILSYAVRKLHAIAGVAITASHNPPQYNGYKVYGEDGAQLGPEAADSVTAYIHANAYETTQAMAFGQAIDRQLLKIIGNTEVDDDYIADVKTLSIQPELLNDKGAELKIVYTPLHGSGNVPVRRILKEMGVANVLVVNEQELPDPNFSTIKVPNPEDPAAFAMAIELAKKADVSVIFATDPDCDRVGVAVRDGKGEYRLLTGNQIGCLLLHYILSTKKELETLPKNGAACKSIVTTGLANAICESFDVEMCETLTGFKFIGEKIQQFIDNRSHTFLFGFEESYGYLSSTFVRDKDGVNASMLIAELAADCMVKGITLNDKMQQIFETYGYYVEKVISKTMPGKDGIARMQEIMRALRKQPPAEIGGLKVLAVRDYLLDTRTENGASEPMGFPASDVLYFELENRNWICVRPSGTEPKIKLYVNTVDADEKKAEKLNEHLQSAANKLLD